MITTATARISSLKTVFKVCSCNVNRFFSKRHNSSSNSENSFGEKSVEKPFNVGDLSSKYKEFREEDSEIILDIYEERLKYSNLLEIEETEEQDRFKGLNLERGRTGVFEIEDLVQVLRLENAEDIFVATVAREIKYVDYICIVNGKSPKHMQAIAQFVRRVYKQKRDKGDIVPRLEGEDSNDWMALDLGNIALHIFSKKARTFYDLDSLWAVGPKFDYEYNKKEPISDMLEMHSQYLAGLEPAS